MDNKESILKLVTQGMGVCYRHQGNNIYIQIDDDGQYCIAVYAAGFRDPINGFEFDTAESAVDEFIKMIQSCKDQSQANDAYKWN